MKEVEIENDDQLTQSYANGLENEFTRRSKKKRNKIEDQLTPPESDANELEIDLRIAEKVKIKNDYQLTHEGEGLENKFTRRLKKNKIKIENQLTPPDTNGSENEFGMSVNKVNMENHDQLTADENELKNKFPRRVKKNRIKIDDQLTPPGANGLEDEFVNSAEEVKVETDDQLMQSDSNELEKKLMMSPTEKRQMRLTKFSLQRASMVSFASRFLKVLTKY